MIKFVPNEKFIRTFINEYWGQAIEESENLRGRWISVKSPWRQTDTRLCLGFNLDKKYVHDMYTSSTWSFVKFVQEYLEHESYNKTLKFLVDFAVKYDLLNTGLLEDQDIKIQVPDLPKQITFAPLPDIQFPNFSVSINLEVDDPFTKHAVDYLKDRVTQEEINKYNIRYCTEGYFGGRIILPVLDENGRFVWYQGRSIFGQEPKYLNPKGDYKSQIVFGLDKVENERIVICEGVFDAIKISGCSTFGKNISLVQLEKIKNTSHKELILAYDNDVPGIDGTIKAIKILTNARIDFKIVLFPFGVNDFGDMGKEDALSLIDKAVSFNIESSNWIYNTLILMATYAQNKIENKKI